MGKLMLPTQPKMKENYKPAQDLTKMGIEELYNYQNQINEYTEKELYWRINREIQKRRVQMDRDIIIELKQLRSSINLLKLAMEDMISLMKERY